MTIVKKHLGELEASGISRQTAENAGIRSIDSTLSYLDFELGSAWACPFFGLNGEPPVYQLKPDTPRTDREGKIVKYEWPANIPLRLYIPPFMKEKILDPKVPLLITEGTKKSLKACQDGFACIALSGVWGWLHDGEPLPEFKIIPWKQRLVHLCFDSDVLTKENVQQALFRFERFLRGQGADVRIVSLAEVEK